MTRVAADLTDDDWPDIYVASDSTAAILYRNNRDGTFTDVARRERRRLQRAGQRRRPAWAWPSATTTATAAWTSSRRTSPTTSRRSIETSARACSRTSAAAAGLAVREPLRAVGRRHARFRQRRLAGSVVCHRQRLSGDRALAAAVSAPLSARRLSQPRRRPLRARQRARGTGRRGAAFEPRRGVRRHRQRRRHRRARHEHERAAVAAQQRLHAEARVDRRAAERRGVQPARPWARRSS